MRRQPKTNTNNDLASEIWRNIFIVLMGAAAIWLGFANDFATLPPLVLLWPVATVLLAFQSQTFAQAFFYGWLVNFLGGYAALYWLYLPIKEVGGFPLPFAIACAISISAYIALQGGFFGLICKHLKNISPVCALFAICLAWYLLEYAFARVIGFPWLSISGALSIWPLLIQVSRLLGAWLTCALWLVPCVALVFFFYTKQKKFVFISAAFILFFLGFGAYSMQNRDMGGGDVNAIFIEGNVDQNQKWLPAFQQWTLELYLNLSRDALDEAITKNIAKPLLIWPETSLPFFFEKNRFLARELQRGVREIDAPLIFGAPGVSDNSADGQREKIYNRAFLMAPDGELTGYYDKRHLVPFGEFLPAWLDFKFLGALLQGVGIYDQGVDPSPLRYKDLALGMLICYEGIFPWLAQETTARGANILVDISNDGWFGRTPAARQHLYLTVARCVEQNRWLFRATNTGISAVVSNSGKITETGEQFARGYMFANGKTLAIATIYSKIANYLPGSVFALFLSLVFLGKNRKVGNMKAN